MEKHFKQSKLRVALSAILVISAPLVLTGCLVEGDESTSNANSVTNPVHNFDSSITAPTGTIQGILKDKVTGDPIVGAKINLGISSAVTNELGQYVINNVPVTTATAEGQHDHRETYQVNIDMREVINHSGYDYPNFIYDTISVGFGRFTPLEAQAMVGSNFQQGTFHQIISGLVSAHDMQIGKLSTSITGRVVIDTGLAGLVPFSPAENATVRLYYINEDVNRSNRLVASVTTNEQGRFTFEGLETLANVRLVAIFADQYGEEYFGEMDTKTPEVDGEELRLTLLDSEGVDGLRGEAIKLGLLENQGPVLTEVSPANYSDLVVTEANEPVEVRFTFNHPIERNAYALAVDASSSAIQGLHRDVKVLYNGAKMDQQIIRDEQAGGQAEPQPKPTYSLSWSDDDRTLIVTMHNLAKAAKYEVDITAAEGDRKLMDHRGRSVNLTGRGSNEWNAPAKVEFSTRLGLMPETPMLQPIVNIDSQDNVVLSWNAVANARQYVVYRESIVNSDLADYRPGFTEIARTGNTHYTDDDTQEFIYDDRGSLWPVEYRYTVTAVSADGIESALDQNGQVARDTIKPRFLSHDANFSFDTDSLTLTLSEKVKAADIKSQITIHAQTDDEQSITVTEASLNQGDTDVMLTLSGVIDPSLLNGSARQQETETFGRLTTGWNGVWRSNSRTELNSWATEVETEDNLPALSSGLCMEVGASGQLFTRDSEGYDNHIPLSFQVTEQGFRIDGNLNTNHQDAIIKREDGSFAVYTGPNGICNSITGLLNYYHTDDNTVNFTNDQLWTDALEIKLAADKTLTQLASDALATSGEHAIRANLLPGVVLQVLPSHFRTANRSESLTQLAINGVDEFWTNPTDLSLPTLSLLTQGFDLSRPGSARLLNEKHQFVLPGAAPAEPRANVLYARNDNNELNPTIDHRYFAWRGTASGPQTTTHVATFKADLDDEQKEQLAKAVSDLGDSISRHYRLDKAYTNGEFEVLTIASGALQDIAGNQSLAHTLIRSFTWNEDKGQWDIEDSFKRSE